MPPLLAIEDVEGIKLCCNPSTRLSVCLFIIIIIHHHLRLIKVVKTQLIKSKK